MIPLFGAAGAAAFGFVCFVFSDTLMYYFVYDRAGSYDRGGEMPVHVIAAIGAVLGGAAGIMAGRYMAKSGFCHSRHIYVGGILGAAMLFCFALSLSAHDLVEPWDMRHRWTEIWVNSAFGAAAGAVIGAIGHHCWLAAGGTRPCGGQRWQFSIRESLVWITVFAVLVGPLVGVAGRQYSFYDRRRANTVPLIKYGAMIEWDSPTSTHLEDIRGVEFFGRIIETTAQWDEALSALTQCRNLEELAVFAINAKKVNLERIEQLEKLRVLRVHAAFMTDDGLQHIGQLSALEELELNSPKITTAGLAHMHGLKRLRKVDIFPYDHLRPGLKKLKAALPECEFQWDP